MSKRSSRVVSLGKEGALRLFMILVGALGASGALGCTRGAEVEEAEQTDLAIVGGHASTAYPAVGYLAREADDLPFCTATLVTTTYVVTAAHCVRGERASELVFGTGSFHPTLRRTSIKRCKNNSSYRPSVDSSLVYDFAFCELSKPVAGTTPLAIATAPAMSAKYVAVGYGQTDTNDEDSLGPRKALDVRRLDPDDESDLDGLEHMLAVVGSRGDTCFGDSGGPLLVISSNGTARIAGVLDTGISEGSDDCARGNIGLYAPLAANMTFFQAR